MWTFWARTDSNNANNPALNLTGDPAIQITFVESGTNGDLILETNGGAPDPDTQVEIGGTLYDFTFELSAELPTLNRDGAGQVPDQFEGSAVFIVTVHDYPSAGETTRLTFLPDETATQAEMDAFGNGAIDLQNTGTEPAPDYIVEGTSGDDVIDATYAGDLEGDRIDNNDGNPLQPGPAGGDNDSVTAGAGNDYVASGSGDDTVLGEAGNDTLIGGVGNDSLVGGIGHDSIDGGSGDDTIDGGDGNDTINTSTGSDLVSGGAGDDFITGAGDDVTSNDTMDGGAGNDTLIGGLGDDSLTGDTGNDVFVLGQDDTGIGGDGDDIFYLADYGETGAGTINIVGGEGAETTGDTLYLGPDVSFGDITFTNTDDAAGGLSGNFTMADGTVVTFTEIENIICFTPGTRILTQYGERPIETLQLGDMVVTRDHGLRPIRWIGKRTVPGKGRFAPVRVGASAVDGARTGLLVSPQHRILFTGYKAELLFGETEVLVPAKHLIDGHDVVRADQDEVTYIHLMFDCHEVIYAEGIATESFHAGDTGLSAVCEAAREELFTIFPELRTAPGAHLKTARPCLKKFEAKLLAGDNTRVAAPQQKRIRQAKPSAVARQLNKRPNKTLRYQAPAEKLERCVAAMC